MIGREQRIALVVADVDGTLVTSEKVLTARAAKAVMALYASGIAFAITRISRWRLRAQPRP